MGDAKLKKTIWFYFFVRFAGWVVEKTAYFTPKRLVLSLSLKLYQILKGDAGYRLSHNKNIEAIRKYMERGQKEVNKKYIATFIRSFLVCNSLIWPYLRKKSAARYKTNIPQKIAFSVTNKCNLACIGCYSSEHSKDTLPYEVVKNKILGDGNTLGVGLFTVLGGEPLLYPHILDLVKDRSSFFTIFTNGYYLDEKKADFFSKAGNVGIFFGLAGYKESTDRIRGEGAFHVAREKMKMLKKRGAPFGISILVTKENWEEVSSVSFVDDAIGWGVYNISYFLYGPIGREPDMNLVIDCKERATFNSRIDHLLKTKPVIILNEMNHRCEAGASNDGMLHINASGDIEPCFAIQFSTENIFKSTLVDALQSELFSNIRKSNSEFSCGCIVCESTEKLVDSAKSAKSYPTQPHAEQQYTDLIKTRELGKV